MLRSLTHPDTHPDSSEKHNSRAKFKDEINIHKLSKGGLKGYKIRWWQNGKRKEAYRKSYEDAVAFRRDITEKVLFGSPKAFKKTHLSDSQLACIWWLRWPYKCLGGGTISLKGVEE